MKMQLISDLHLEQEENPSIILDQIKTTAGNDTTLILAGDILPLIMEETWDNLLPQLIPYYQNVILVPGNHEYYGTSLNEGHKLLTRLSRKGLIVLNRNKIEKENNTIVGTTLWFQGDVFSHVTGRAYNDLNCIKNISISTLITEGDNDKDYLKDTKADSLIWITHFLPHYRSVGEKFQGSPMNTFFVNDLSPIIKLRWPKLIMHGHTHESKHYYLGDTLVLSNPKGYGSENKDFEPNLIIEI